MLHSKKSQSILQWYNSLTLKGNVNSLEQFTDGSLFYDILPFSQSKQLQESKEDNLAAEPVIFSDTGIACNEEVITSVEEEAAEGKIEASVSENVNADSFIIKESDHTDTQKKYNAIEKFIDDTYHLQSSSLIDYGECQKGKELELAKVAVFLLSALVQNLLCLDDDMVKNTTLLDMEVQENIKECMSLVLVEDQIKKSELNKVLSRAASYKGTPLRKQRSRNTPDTNDLSEGVKNVPKKRRERAFASEDIQHSPIERLLDSPKIQDRVYILRKEELRKLRNALDYEESQVMELRMDKKNLNQELEKRKRELDFYKKELESLREALGEKEEQEKLRVEELKDKKIELEKYKKLIENLEEEMKLLRKNNEALEEKVADIEKKLEQDATACLVNENNNLKDNIQLLNLDNEKKDEIIKALEEKIKSLQSEMKMMNQDVPVPNTRREITRSPNVPETLSNIIYADEQNREKLERKEHELRQDRDVKDERIKRLTRMGEIPKNKNTNVESLQNMVDHLLEENIKLKEKLESYESQPGSTSFGASVAIDLKSVKKENDGIGPAEMDDASESSFSFKNYNKADDQLYARISDNFSKNADLMAIAFNKGILAKIISCLAKKQLLEESLAVALKEKCSEVTDGGAFSVFLQDLKAVFQRQISTKPSVSTRSSSHAAEELQSLMKQIGKLEKENKKLQQKNKELEGLQLSNALELEKKMEEAEKLRQDVSIFEEKYINMEKLAKKKDEDVKKALLMYQKIAKLKKKDNDSEKKCGEECEKLRRRCKQLNEECLDFEQETAELKRSVKNLEGMMEHLQFEIKELNKEKKELQLKLWEETSALSKNTTDRDALVLHYLKKSKHEPKKNKIIELKKEEQKKSGRPIVKVDAYILNSENEPSTSNSVLASRSIRSSFFQVADEDDFLNESSLAEIHHGGMLEGESAENRLLELQRRNTLCPPHLQSSYPLEIQDMTPSERKYFYSEDVSFDMGRKSSQFNGKRDIHSKPKSRYAESDSDDSDDTHSFPVKKLKISEADRISVPVFKRHYQDPVSKRHSVSVAKRSSKDHENSRKPPTPMKRAAAYMKKKASFITPSSVNRLMRMPRKSKLH